MKKPTYPSFLFSSGRGSIVVSKPTGPYWKAFKSSQPTARYAELEGKKPPKGDGGT